MVRLEKNIPPNWRNVQFGELISDLGYGPRFSGEDYDNLGNVKTIRGTDISPNGEILYDQVPIAKLHDELIKTHSLKVGDLVMITTADCGITGVFKDSTFPYIPSAYAVKISLNNQADSDYFKYFVQSDIIKRQIRMFIRKGTVANLPGSDIKFFKFLLPPLSEQQKIAAILSKWDELIETQTQLILAKEKQKTSLMQKLLTGEVRFPGFEDEWEYKILEEVLDYEQPTKYIVKSTEYSDNHSTPVLTAGKTFVLGYTDEVEGVFLESLPVIIFDDFTTANKFVDFPFKVKSSAMKILKAKSSEFNIRYIYEMMQTLWFVPTDHKRYWISQFSQLEIPIPSIEEQNKIEGFSASLDNEIKSLKNELEALKYQKKGLMQQLLTGKIRVKV